MQVIEVTDIHIPELDVFAKLTEHQLRSRQAPAQGMFIAESSKVIGLALQAGLRPTAFLMERKRLTDACKDSIARCGDVPVYIGDRDVLSSLTGYALTRGILCAFRRPVLPSAETVCQGAERIAVLDGITDAVNVGAIFRSAAALDIDAVLLTRSCCDPLCRRAVRVSMGTLFQIPWAWLDEDISTLKDLGFKTVSMALRQDAISIDDPVLGGEGKLAIIFGSEGYGLPQREIEACDYVVKIPMAHDVDSLNVAAASAVTFWQLRKKR